jgi:hypothetical protein
VEKAEMGSSIFDGKSMFLAVVQMEGMAAMAGMFCCV